MKKKLSLLLVLILLVTLVVGCKGKEPEEVVDETKEKVEEKVEEVEEIVSDSEIVEFGLGKVTKRKGTEKGEKPATAQIDVTAAAVGFDKDGKVVKVIIDTVQNKANFDEEMNFATELDTVFRTKKELKEEYDMKRASDIGKEWDEQMYAFEDWMVGKTVEEIVNMPYKQRDENHVHVPDVEELTSTVTMTVEGYIAAVEDAWENREKADDIEEIGLGVLPSIARSNGLDGDKMPKLQADVTISATAFDKDGKVAGVQIDTVQTTVEFDKDGKVTTDLGEKVLTKKEIKDDYNMKKASDIGKEWYEQIEALEDWMVGKTVEEIVNMPHKKRDDKHLHVPDVEELTSTVTITVEGYIGSVEKSEANRK